MRPASIKSVWIQPGTDAGIFEGRSNAPVMTFLLRQTLWPSTTAGEVKASSRGLRDSCQPWLIWVILFIAQNHLLYARYHLLRSKFLSELQRR